MMIINFRFLLLGGREAGEVLDCNVVNNPRRHIRVRKWAETGEVSRFGKPQFF